MDDSISRQAVIDALEKVSELYPWRVPGDRDSYSSYNEAWQDALNRAENEIEALPAAQPEKRTEERTETHACDLIDRQAAIDAVNDCGICIQKILDLPAVQPQSEIVRCKDCAKREICRTSTTWAVAPKDDWYCADAERREHGSD